MNRTNIAPAHKPATGIIIRESIADLAVDHIVPEKLSFAYPLVFVPGMWSGSWIFRKAVLALAEQGYECYALNLRGHCGSMPVDDIGTVTIDDYVADVSRFIQTLGRPVVLVGHSMGEIIATQAIPQNPLVVAHVGMTSGPPRGVMMGWEAIKRMPKYLDKIFGSRPVSLSERDARDLLFNTLDDEGFAECFRQTCPESGRAARDVTLQRYAMRRLEVPALLIGAAYDRITPNQRPVAKLLGAEYEEVPCCHMLTLDRNYMSVVRTISDWLDGRFPNSYE